MVSEAWREWFYRVEVFRDLLKVQVLSREGGMGWHSCQVAEAEMGCL